MQAMATPLDKGRRTFHTSPVLGLVGRIDNRLQESAVVSILEVYQLKCTQCGKPKRIQGLHVYGNLSQIERTFVCVDCENQPTEPAESAAAATKPAETAAAE